MPNVRTFGSAVEHWTDIPHGMGSRLCTVITFGVTSVAQQLRMVPYCGSNGPWGWLA